MSEMSQENELKKPLAFIGVDPGKSGSICLLCPETDLIEFMDMKERPLAIMTWILSQQNYFNVRIILLEKVHAIQGTSAGSNFTFGFNTGGINWLCECCGCGVDHVTPKTWQKYISVRNKGKAIKKEVGEIVGRLYPKAEIRGPRGGLLDGRSDALAIAHYAAHKWRL